MLRESFAGRNPSHFINSSIVKAFIISEVFLWSSWFSILPLLGVFVVSSVPGGNLQLAAFGYSIYLISRVISELISGKMMSGTTDSKKIQVSIGGLLIGALGIFGFAFSSSILILFTSFIVAGFGIGFASPPKNSLFSSHLDKNKETTEWGVYDAVVFICIALSTALGGFIATQYGFKIFFIIGAMWMLLSVIPYLLYLRKS
jgi:MFS family permease